MATNRDRALAAALEAERLADRYDDGVDRAGLLAQVQAQVSTTYAVLAIAEYRPAVEVIDRGVYADGQHLWVLVADASRDGARELAQTYGQVVEADVTDDGRWSHEVVTAPTCTCDTIDDTHAPGCPVNAWRIAVAVEHGDTIE